MSESILQEEKHIEIDFKLINQLMRIWPKRTTVRGCYFDELKKNESFDPSVLDYPINMVPFWDHPNFSKLDDEIKYKTLTWGWINYNQRTIHAEVNVANPAFELLMDKAVPGCDDFAMRSVVQQSLIDEHFHSFMHYNAIESTLQLRNLEDNPNFPLSVTYRELVRAQSEVSEKWEKNMLVIVWAIVSEVSINAFLDLLSGNKEIQPMHSLIARLHNVDEYSHASVLVEISKSVFIHMNEKQRAFFIKYLPRAMDAFCAQDFSTWNSVLDSLDVEGGDKIIQDTINSKKGGKLIRDFSGLEKIVMELGIEKSIDFDFNPS
jgi:hypothetical protein